MRTAINNAHGFEEKEVIELGGVAWAIIETFEGRVKCIAADVIEQRAFDVDGRNDWACAEIRDYLNGQLLEALTESKETFPAAAILEFSVDLTARDNGTLYGVDHRNKIGMITEREYGRLCGTIPRIGTAWWTATPYRTNNGTVCFISTVGIPSFTGAGNERIGVRPVCVLDSERLRGFLDWRGMANA